MKKKTLVINEKWCKACGICVAFCPKNVLSLESKVKIVNENDCIYCGQCEQRCPDYAIYVKEEEND